MVGSYGTGIIFLFKGNILNIDKTIWRYCNANGINRLSKLLGIE